MPVASIQCFEGRNVAREHSNIFNTIMLCACACVEVDKVERPKENLNIFFSLKTLGKQKQKYYF